MKKYLLALLLLLFPTVAFAQCDTLFQNNQYCGNTSGGPALPGPIAAPSFSSFGIGSTTVSGGSAPCLLENSTGTTSACPTLSSLLASPPGIGGTSPAAGAFTTLSATSTLTFGTLSPVSLGASTSTITGLTLNGSPNANNDYVPCYSASGGAIEKCTVASIAGATSSGVTSLGGKTGALSVDSTLQIPSTTLGINLANANTWTGAVTITTNSGNLVLDTPAGSEIAALNFNDHGTTKWAIFNNGPGSDVLNIYNNALTHADITITTADVMSLMPNGGNILAGTTSAATYLELSSSGFSVSLSTNGTGALGASPANGIQLAGQGSIYDLSLENKSLSIAYGIPTGTTNSVFYGDAYFGGSLHGTPWVDVRSGANSCAAAVGDNSTNDQPAIQCQITWLTNHVGAGVLFFPCSNGYKITSGLTITVPIILVGADPICSVITTGGADFTALTWKNVSSIQRGGGLRDIWVQCQQTGTPATPCVEVSDFIEQKWFSYYIWGGNPGFYLCGSTACGGGFGMGDNTFTGGNVHTGSTSGTSVLELDSIGNNFYDSKFDLSGQNANTAIFFENDGNRPDAPNGISENYMSRADLSGGGGGNYTYSMQVNDTVGAKTVVTINYAVMGGLTNMNLGTFRAIMLSNVELGSGNPSIISGNLTVTGSVAGNGGGGSVTFTGGTRSCSGNIGVTC